MKFKYRAQNWTVYWVDLICALIRILTFGYWYPMLDMDIRCFWAKRKLQQGEKK